MSVKIGDVMKGGNEQYKIGEVWVSLAGVEVHWVQATPPTTLDPVGARNYAALLVRGSEEVERMRNRHAIDEVEAMRRTFT